MVRVSTGGLLTLVGLVGLVHTTVAVIQCARNKAMRCVMTELPFSRKQPTYPIAADRQLLKLSQEEFEALPAKIVLELCFSVAVAVCGTFVRVYRRE